jgi:hypothetical protein
VRTTLRLGLAAAAAALIVTTPSPAPGAAGKLEAPGVAFSAGYPAEAQAKVMKVLKRADCKFLGGTWLNSWTTLRYQGDVGALNQFVGDLVKCPGVTVHVSLKRLTDDADWRVGHSAHQNRFQVEVNLDSRRVELEKLYIPAFTGPEIKP